MRPWGPLPRTAPRFTFSSFARRRTAGAARASPEEGGGGGGAEVLLGAGGGADDAGRAAGADGVAGGASPSSPKTTRVAPTLTTSPSFARSWRTLPVTGDGICTVTLSVITSTTGSFSRMGSPSFTNHLTTSPSWTPSPMSGSLNSRAIVPHSDVDIVRKTRTRLNILHLGRALVPATKRIHFMAVGRCLLGEEWRRGGVAQTGGRDLCPAPCAGAIPVLLLLSLRCLERGAAVGHHDPGRTRRPRGLDLLPHLLGELHRRARIPAPLPGGGSSAPPERVAVLRHRHRAGGRESRAHADARVGLGLAILASLVTLVYVGYNAFLRPDASLTLTSAITLVIGGAVLIYLLSVSRAFRQVRPSM